MNTFRCRSVLMAWLSLVAVAFLWVSCGWHDGDEDQLKADVDSFAVSYFNWRYAEAVAYCTGESFSWLQFAASNVHKEDVDSLRAMDSGATCEIDDVDYTSDSTVVVRFRLSNVLVADTMGQGAHLLQSGRAEIPMVYRGKWKVHLTGVLRVK